MVTGYTKQPEAVAVYKNYGFDYPDEVMPDAIHEQKFMKQTAGSPKQLNICYIPSLTRVRKGQEEFVTYSLMYRRQDALGNWHHSFLPNMGIIPKVQPITRVRKDENGWEKRYTSRLDVIDRDYIIPFEGRKTIKELIKKYGDDCIRDKSTEEGMNKALQKQAEREKWAQEHDKIAYQQSQENGGWTQFYVKNANDRITHGIRTPPGDTTTSMLDVWCSASFDDILRFGYTPSDIERTNRLAAEEVAKAQKLTSATSDSMTAEALEKAKELLKSGIPYK